MQSHETQENQVTNTRSKERDLHNRKCSLHEKTISLETFHLKKVRRCHLSTWSRQGRVAQQKAIIKEVRRHVQLNHRSDSNTTDKITQKGEKQKEMVGQRI